MSDYLARLAARTLGVADVVEPRPVSRFEPSPGGQPVAPPGDTTAGDREGDDRGEHAASPHVPPPAIMSRAPTVATIETAPTHAGSETPPASGRAESATGLAERWLQYPASRVVRASDASPAFGRTPRTVPTSREARSSAREAVMSRALEPAAAAPAGSVHSLAPATPHHLDRDDGSVSPGSPVVRISIGRLEVRAVRPPLPPAPRPAPRATGPALPLDEYLRQRSEGRR